MYQWVWVRPDGSIASTRTHLFQEEKVLRDAEHWRRVFLNLDDDNPVEDTPFSIVVIDDDNHIVTGFEDDDDEEDDDEEGVDDDDSAEEE